MALAGLLAVGAMAGSSAILAPGLLSLGGAPLLLRSALPPDRCAALAACLNDLELSKLALVKAFHPSGSAESLAPPAVGLAWVYEYGACAGVAGRSSFRWGVGMGGMAEND